MQIGIKEVVITVSKGNSRKYQPLIPLNVESILYRKAQKLTLKSDARESKSESKEVDFAYYFHIYIREILR